ncbi:hypothetical protein B0H10DRAFT_1939093 [Mycena sp. CBHHK59/15]|nr:hypothetical protein B0H10DRAFT_1939093 [Mycena sp. CBHHK59/15]
MQLILTTATPSNSVYIDSSGTKHYKVQTPFKVHDRTTTISRAIDSDIPQRLSESSNQLEPHDADEDAKADQIRFGSLAYINWRVVESSVIHFCGRELETKSFLRKDGWGWYGRHRVFTALDGKEYKWCLGAYTSQLRVNDATETLVARYKPKKFGLFSKPRKASLEISPPFEYMMDEILVTFVYIERLRKTKEYAAHSPTLFNKL